MSTPRATATAPATALRRDRPAPPVRAVHLGLGGFFRAHQAWYTHAAGADGHGEPWGIAAFSGRSRDLADALAAQDGLYTLITRAADGDRYEVVGSVREARAAADHDAWLRHLASPAVAVVTTTVTEAGYLRGADGGLDRQHPQVAADADALRADVRAPVRTAPARLLAGLLARRAADAGPLALVPCDNLPGNGAALARVVRDLAEVVDPGALDWLTGQVTAVTTMVDRITPAPTDQDRASVLAATGVEDSAPVATEPFTEWVLSGEFPAGRPAWDRAGAVLTDDITPFEERKLWLLNGGHSLLAYAGSVRGHATVADAVRDPACRRWLQEWWDVAAEHLPLPEQDVTAYREALTDRFANPRMQHRLDQIAADGSQKLPVRILPALRRERAAGRLPAAAAVVLASWVRVLRGEGAPLKDVRGEELVDLAAGDLRSAVPRVLGALDPALPDDRDLVSAVLAAVEDVRS